MRRLFLCALLTASALHAQEFEVVSVKPNKSGTNGSSTNTDRGRLTGVNVSLRQLIVMAYGLKDYQVEGPDWLGMEHFDISAKFPDGMPTKDPEKYRAAFEPMVQKMLADRFKVTVHRDQKSFAVYGLLVTKGGVKFKEAAPTEEGHSSSSNNNHYTGKNIAMDTFANFLSRREDLPVLDMTGLKGFYDLTLDWVPEPKQPDAGAVADISTGLTLPMALQEHLGLKLENRKAPIEILIVDHAERVPTEN